MPLCKALIVACVQRCNSILVNIGSDRVSHHRRTQHGAWALHYKSHPTSHTWSTEPPLGSIRSFSASCEYKYASRYG